MWWWLCKRHVHGRSLYSGEIRLDFRTRMIMTTAAKKSQQHREHLNVTANQTRNNGLFEAVVTHTAMLSRTVKLLSLNVDDARIYFKSGQWVDFMVASLPNSVGGYSICSSIEKLLKERIIDLAVKQSDYPTAKWIHEQCRLDDKVNIRIGGNFFYDPESELDPGNQCPHDILLVAGGVGINPIFSILQHAEYISKNMTKNSELNVQLLYSAKTQNELIFKDLIIDICQRCQPNFKCHFFTTEEPDYVKDLFTTKGRMTSHHILQAVSCFKNKSQFAYICGPVDMLNFVESALVNSSISRQNVRYEKWW